MTTHPPLTPSCQPGEPAGEAPGCSIGGCTRAHRARGYCGAHYRRWSRHGDPLAGGPSRTRTAPGYAAAHRLVVAERGPADRWSCANCAGTAALWSYDGTDPGALTEPGRRRLYSLDPGRYRPLCRSCHRRATVHGPDARGLDAERAARLYRAGASARGIAALLGASPGTVLAALRTQDVPIRPPGPRRRQHSRPVRRPHRSP